MNRMKELREEKKISMKEAARRLGIPYTTYVNYEKGLREPNSEMLINISNFFNCTIDYLLGKSNDRIDENLLDKVNETDDYPLRQTGNFFDAKYEEIMNLLTNMMAPSDRNPLLERIHFYSNRLNAQGLTKLGDYAEDLSANPKYQKKKPSNEG